jgi:hypothetical protein
MSFQIAVMKVLSSYPAGTACLTDLKRDLAILVSSGPDWDQRMKRLAGRAPSLDAFSQGYIKRDATGWAITSAGRDLLEALERPIPDTVTSERTPVFSAFQPPVPLAFTVKIVGRRDRKHSLRRRRRVEARLSA